MIMLVVHGTFASSKLNCFTFGSKISESYLSIHADLVRYFCTINTRSTQLLNFTQA